jgi:glycosyltransferase involved in cell wall biosynthesis
MKILIVNFSDTEGGAARAAYRLHQSLLEQRVDSNMLVQKKVSDDFTVIAPKTRFRKLLVQLQGLINPYPLKRYNVNGEFSASFSPSFGLTDVINELKPDVVHLHWINAGMLKIEDLSKIKAPIVWSLHDMWAFTGGCHYDDECAGYLSSCGNCKILQSDEIDDLSKRIYKRKLSVYSRIESITVVGLSKWLSMSSKSSSLFRKRLNVNLPNPINTDVFKPIDKMESKKIWNLAADKKIILFGAMNATSSLRKGFKELVKAMKNLNDDGIELAVFGSNKPEEKQDWGLKINYLGMLSDDVSLVTLYNAVDVLVVPSIQENLSNAIMESLSCGTPVVAFDIGGNSDLIDHKENGYLAKAFDTIDLSNGINWVLNAKDCDLSENSREKVLNNFSYSIVSKKYIELYKKVLSE